MYPRRLTFLLVGVSLLAGIQIAGQFLGPFGTTVVILFVAMLAASAAVMRYRPALLAAACGSRWIDGWLQFVHRVTGVPLPDGPLGTHLESRWARSLVHWPAQMELLRSAVQGHEQTVDEVGICLRELLLTRLSSRVPVDRPLAAFAFLGTAGIGRRSLARACAQVLGAEELVEIACDQYADDAQLAAAITEAAPLVTSRNAGKFTLANRLLLVRNLEAAGPRSRQALANWLGTSAGRVTSCSPSGSCLIVVTVDLPPDVLQDRKNNASPRIVDEVELIGALPDCASLLASLDGIFTFRPPTTNTAAEVIGQLMQQECSRFGVRLDYVAPAVLAIVLKDFRPEHGFRRVAARIPHLLRTPIARSLAAGRKTLVLVPELVSY